MSTAAEGRGGASLGDRLARARRRRFVGRAAEMAALAAALADPGGPAVVHVHGPGGVGKSALLEAFGRVAAEAGRPPVALDARDAEPSPEGLLGGLRAALGAPANADVHAELRRRGRPVLLLDACERLAPLERWLRERFLPALPAGALTVMAGREPPGPEWRGDPSWQEMLLPLPLRNLPPEDGEALLAAGGVPEAARPRALELTHGHPLALSLVVDVQRQHPGRPLELEAMPDVVQALLQRFLEGVPSPAHRRALEVAAHLRATTEPLLRDALGDVYAERPGPGDASAMLEMTRRHEGPASAALMARWLERQPECFLVFRRGPGAPVGFCAHPRLDLAAEEDRAADPVARAARAEIARRRPPRPGERVRIERFAMDREAHQRSSPGFNLVSVEHLRRIVGEPGLGWDLIAFVEAEAWAPLMAHVDFHTIARVEEARPPVTLFAHDWRAAPVEAWFEAMGARELGAPPDPAAAPAPPLLVLSEPEFAAAVRAALRDVNRPARLAESPLLRSAVLRARAGREPPAEALAELLRAAAEELRADPRDEGLHRVLDRTYLRPAPTQERAAELLGLPFSTYRRHLARAQDRLVRELWRRELEGASG